MNDLILVDTSVFIEYLRGSLDDTLSVLILNNQVLLSPIVKLELLAGVRRKEVNQLEKLLNSLITISNFQSTDKYEKILHRAKGSGLLGGIADLIILSDTMAYKAKLFTLDARMIKLAKKLRISLFD